MKNTSNAYNVELIVWQILLVIIAFVVIFAVIKIYKKLNKYLSNKS